MATPPINNGQQLGAPGQWQGTYFHNRWAVLKLVGEASVASVKTAYYTTAYIGSRLVCSEEIYVSNRDHAINNAAKMGGRLGAAILFGSNLITPSVNQPDPEDIPKEEEILEDLQVSSKLTEDLETSQKYVREHCHDVLFGVCFGKSMDSIARTENVHRITPQLIADISESCAGGAPKRAVIAQFLYKMPQIKKRDEVNELTENLFGVYTYKKALKIYHSPDVYEKLKNLIFEMPTGQYEIALIGSGSAHSVHIKKNDSGEIFLDDSNFGISYVGKRKEELCPIIKICKFYKVIFNFPRMKHFRIEVTPYLQRDEERSPELKAWRDKYKELLKQPEA